MATYNKFNSAIEDIVEGRVNLATDTFKVFLTNTAPNASTHTQYDGVTGSTGPAEIAAGNGYTATGVACTVSSSGQTGGVYKLVLTDPNAITASGGPIPSTGAGFRYVVLYSSTSTNKHLLGWWDYGSTISLADGESFSIDLSQTNGVLTIS